MAMQILKLKADQCKNDFVVCNLGSLGLWLGVGVLQIIEYGASFGGIFSGIITIFS